MGGNMLNEGQDWVDINDRALQRNELMMDRSQTIIDEATEVTEATERFYTDLKNIISKP